MILSQVSICCERILSESRVDPRHFKFFAFRKIAQAVLCAYYNGAGFYQEKRGMLLNKIYVSFIVGRPTRLNKKTYRLKTCLLLVAFVSACAQAPVQGQAPRSPTPASVKGVVDVQTIA